MQVLLKGDCIICKLAVSVLKKTRTAGMRSLRAGGAGLDQQERRNGHFRAILAFKYEFSDFAIIENFMWVYNRGNFGRKMTK